MRKSKIALFELIFDISSNSEVMNFHRSPPLINNSLPDTLKKKKEERPRSTVFLACFERIFSDEREREND